MDELASPKELEKDLRGSLLFYPNDLSWINEVRVCDVIPFNDLLNGRAVLFGDAREVFATLDGMVDLFGFGRCRLGVLVAHDQLLPDIDKVGVGYVIPLN